MLERLLENENVVSHLLSSTPTSSHIIDLTASQWTTTSQMVSVLRPFVEVTVEMLRSSYPLLSTVIPLVVILSRAVTSSTGCVEVPVDLLLRLIEENFHNILNDDQLCAATVMGLYSTCC